MLPKALLAVRRYQGRIYPRYADPGKHQGLAEALIQLYQEHVGRKRGELEEALASLESHQTFKLVRGLSELLERRCEFSDATSAKASAIAPQELRAYLFRLGYVISPEERRAVLEKASQELDLELEPEEMEKLFWADLEEEQLLKRFDPPSPIELLKQYNLSLTQTLLFDATELEFLVKGNFQEIFRRIKRLGLMYEVEATDDDEDEGKVRIKVTGPASLFGQITRYGTSFAKLLPAIMRAEEWELLAKIKAPAGGGSWGAPGVRARARKPRIYEFEIGIGSSKRGLLEVAMETEEPEQEQGQEAGLFDSAVERDFAGRIRHIMPEWEVKREPTVLKAGRYAFIPDFGFELKRHRHGRGIKRLYLEIVGFWTEDYLKKKIAKLGEVVPEIPLIIAVDKDLNCSAEDFQVGRTFTSLREVIFYDKALPLEPVIKRLQQLAEEQAREELERLGAEEIPLPDKSVISLQELAEEHGVGIEVIRRIVEERRATDETRKLIGEKIVKVELLEELRAKIEALPYLKDQESRDYFQAKELLEDMGLPESALKEIGYRVEWRQLLPPDARVVKAKAEPS
ncbi:MAG: DUF790 family protein [Candidatus Bipolaricaulia bacterium]